MRIARGVSIVLSCLVLMAVVLPAVAGCGATDSAPKVSWNSPSQGDEVFGIARLKVKASSGGGVSEVSFYCDSVDNQHLIGTVTSPADSLYTQVWYTTDVANGEHTLYAVALDDKEQSEEASRTVTVSNLTRADAITSHVTWAKRTPQTDLHPPELDPAFSAYWKAPEMLGAPINTTGYEDSCFITPDGNNLYFFFTADMYIDVTKQVLDGVTGIYWSQNVGGTWTEPRRVWLNYYDDPALDGAEAITGNTMWFGSARTGNYHREANDANMWTAQWQDGRWTDWANAGQKLNVDYEIGELHVSADGNEIYFHSERPGGKGAYDLWVTRKVNGQWQQPENVAAVNTADGEGWPCLSPDGNELWFTRNINSIPAGIYRSVKVNGQWQTPERVLSGLAGEPTLDSQGNLYFVHHYYDDSAQRMWEADIYICRRKS